MLHWNKNLSGKWKWSFCFNFCTSETRKFPKKHTVNALYQEVFSIHPYQMIFAPRCSKIVLSISSHFKWLYLNIEGFNCKFHSVLSFFFISLPHSFYEIVPPVSFHIRRLFHSLWTHFLRNAALFLIFAVISLFAD